jgi:hypothetical protein
MVRLIIRDIFSAAGVGLIDPDGEIEIQVGIIERRVANRGREERRLG